MPAGTAISGGLSSGHRSVQIGGKTAATLDSAILKNRAVKFDGVLTADCTVTFQIGTLDDSGEIWVCINNTTGSFNLFCQGPVGAAYNLPAGATVELIWDGANLRPVDGTSAVRSGYGQVTIPSTASPTVNLTAGQANPTVISLLGSPSGAPVVNTNVLSSYWLFDNRTGAPVTIKYQGGLGAVVPQGSTGLVFIDSSGTPTLASDTALSVILAPAVPGRNTVQPTLDNVEALTLKWHSAGQSAPVIQVLDQAGNVQVRVTAAGVFQGPDGVGTDINGGDVVLAAGQGTGLGQGGALRFRTNAGGIGSGSTLNSQYDKLILADGFGTQLFEHSGTNDILQVLSIEAASGGSTRRRVPGIFYRGFYWTGSASVAVDVGTDLEVVSTTPHYQWRVITGGQPRIKVGEAGQLIFAATSQPADSDLLAGDFALTLDPTNGASKLNIRAKSTNGTVVTASIALA